MKELTRAEEQIMQVMWELGPCFVKDIIEKLPSPKPAYNTVSTIVRILEQKNFVNHHQFGKTHQYFASISKDQYRAFATEKLMEGYFGNSVESVFSFFVEKNKIDIGEADEILKMIQAMK